MSLEIRDVRAGYASGEVLHGVSVTVSPGTVTALVGANGAGKSTLLKVASGLLRPRGGSVAADGADMSGKSCAGRVRAGIVMVPEGRQVFGGLSVLDNVALGAWAAGGGAGRAAAAERRRRIEAVWDLFPVLAERKDVPAGLLSGGQQQMVAIGRGLAAGPRYLLLDEPSLGLAPIVVATIFERIAELAARGIGVLVVEQNATVALRTASFGYLLESGGVADSGPDLLDRPELTQRYFGVRGVVRGDGAPAMAAVLRAALTEG
ncbi:MAG TPA: ABC transporter ATP-binding protein [Trebonia sp.]|nr:ABC transporter ATP-binding protein [Trebonia sp.]